MDRDEFYIGHHERAPNGVARHTRRAVVVALGVGVAVGVASAALQGPFAVKTFEFGREREFAGWLRREPFPRLVVAAPGEAGAVLLSYPLTRAGTKRGAGDLLAGHDGSFVRLRGWLIYREGHTMIDVVPGSLRSAGGGPGGGASAVEDLGDHTLVGEIADGKCFFGVMNPATGKVHRACAIRCISSGSPPVLVVRDRAGEEGVLLLVGADGRPLNRELLDVVATPVEVTGRVSRLDQLLVLRAEPSSIRRVERLARH